MKRRREVRIGTWNTRQLGATQGRHDPHLKFKQLSKIWEHRGWSVVLLSDTKWGRHTEFEIDGHQTTWTIISRGRVFNCAKRKMETSMATKHHTCTNGRKGCPLQSYDDTDTLLPTARCRPYERLLSQFQSHTSRNSGAHGGYQQRCQQTYMSIPARDRGGFQC